MVNPFLKEHNPTTLLPDPHCRETESCGAPLYLNQHTLAPKTRRRNPARFAVYLNTCLETRTSDTECPYRVLGVLELLPRESVPMRAFQEECKQSLSTVQYTLHTGKKMCGNKFNSEIASKSHTITKKRQLTMN